MITSYKRKYLIFLLFIKDKIIRYKLILFFEYLSISLYLFLRYDIISIEQISYKEYNDCNYDQRNHDLSNILFLKIIKITNL